MIKKKVKNQKKVIAKSKVVPMNTPAIAPVIEGGLSAKERERQRLQAMLAELDGLPVPPAATAVIPHDLVALDLGCGDNKIGLDFFEPNMQVTGVTKVIGVDFVKTPSVDVVHDLTQFPYPFADDSIDVVFASHFFEHLDGLQRIKFMDECYRIMKPEAKMRLIHPYGKSTRFFQDPTHKFPPIIEDSYFYFWKKWRVDNKLTHGFYNMKCDFDFFIGYAWHDPTFENKSPEAKVYPMQHEWNIIADLHVTLVKKVGR